MTEFTHRYFFKKKSRLLKYKNYDYVFNKNNKTDSKEFMILARNNNLPYPRIGLIVSKKNIKKSYLRNRIKRLIRETFRLLQHKLLLMDFVILAKKDSAVSNNNKLVSVLKYLWYRYYR
ncbi:MAG: ribonuclease P protein component [Buchnera aphidicola (Eriosoma harunire)]